MREKGVHFSYPFEPAILAELADAMPSGPRLGWPTGGHVPQKTHAAEVAQGMLTLARPPVTSPFGDGTSMARER